MEALLALLLQYVVPIGISTYGAYLTGQAEEEAMAQQTATEREKTRSQYDTAMKQLDYAYDQLFFDKDKFKKEFGLDKDKFEESIRQWNAMFGLTQQKQALETGVATSDWLTKQYELQRTRQMREPLPTQMPIQQQTQLV